MDVVFSRKKTSEKSETPPTHGSHPAGVTDESAPAAEPAAQPAVDEAAARRDRSKPKGVPTPRRKDQEAARRRPLVPEDRKAAKKADREAMAAERAKMRQALETGDERHMPVRDRGPQKRFVRDYVDARWSIGEFLLPVVFLYILLMFIPGREFQLVLMYSLYALVALVIIDSIILGSRIRKALEAKFGVAEPGTKMYAIMRALQFRRLRLPKPQVKRGQHPA